MLEIKQDKAQDFPNFTNAMDYYSVYEKKYKGDKVYDCALAVYMQDIERQIISVMIKTSKENNVFPSSIIHDALLFDINDNKIIVDKKEEIMCILKQSVKDQLGWKVDFESKVIEPTSSDLDIYEKTKVFIKNENNEFDISTEVVSEEATTRPDVFDSKAYQLSRL